MRDPIENVTRLQKQLNNLQLENQVLKNILDKAGLSYQNELASIRKTEKKEDFDPEQGKRIVHPKEITDRMAKLFFSFFWGRTDVYAKRNVNKNGEVAYYPQCDNFWSDNCHRKLNTHIDCKDCKYCSYTRLDLSTILTHLRGKGIMEIDGKVYKRKERLNEIFLVMQDVNHQLFTESVLDEVLISMKKENEEKALDILKSLDLLPYRERHPVSLSGGEKQRVAVATAIASERSVLLFDEPTSGLDYRHMLQVARLFEKLRNHGKTILVVTHDLEFIEALHANTICLEELQA